MSPALISALVSAAVTAVLVILAWVASRNIPQGMSSMAALREKLSHVERDNARLGREVASLRDANAALAQALSEAKNEARKAEMRAIEAEGEVRRLKDRFVDLEHRLSAVDGKAEAQPDPRPILVVGVASGAMFDLDLACALSASVRANFEVTRLRPVRYEKLKEVLDAARRDRHPIREVHLGTHASREAVEFDDGPRNVYDLALILRGVNCLVLNGCESERMSDYLGVVPNVVTMREKVNSEAAGVFTEVFWEEYFNGGGDAKAAFAVSLERIPAELREQVHLRA